MTALTDGGFLMTNFVDFDTNFGHRRDPLVTARRWKTSMRYFPRLRSLAEGDLLVLTADHGNDPTWKGTDHTREAVPVLAYARETRPGSFGHRKTFADIGQAIARHLGIAALAVQGRLVLVFAFSVPRTERTG